MTQWSLDKLSLFSGLYYIQYGEELHLRIADKGNPNYGMSSFMGYQPHYERTDEEGSESLPYINKYSFLKILIGASHSIKEYSKSKIATKAAAFI